jgi:APA family basic amino acid/polyamine antiporter
MNNENIKKMGLWNIVGLGVPVWLFNTCSVLGGFCAAVVAITLFKDLTVKDAIVAAAVIIIPLVFSGIALKTGSVSKEDLHEKRQKIVDAALKAED